MATKKDRTRKRTEAQTGRPAQLQASAPKTDRLSLRVAVEILAGALALSALYMTSLSSYLLFHSLTELLTIVVAGSIFLIVWNTRRFMTNDYVTFLGIAYLFVAALDVLHTLTYSGMGVLPQYNTNVPTQLWIAARALQSISLLVAPIFLSRKVRYGIAASGFVIVLSLLMASIFVWDIFPVCYVDGVGLTMFKKVSEYVISLLFIAGWILLLRNRAHFEKGVFAWLSASILLAVGAELTFTLYVSVYGLSNLSGHMLKLVSFFALYKAIVETGLRKPHELLFKEVKNSEQAFEAERDFAEGLIDTAQAIILVLDVEGRIVRFNRYMEELSGYRLDEVMGKDWITTFLPQRDQARIRELLAGAVAGTPTRSNVSPIVIRSGEARQIEWSDRVRHDGKGSVVGLISIGTDVTERLRAEDLLRHTATHDSLTGLANRAVFDSALRTEIARAQRNSTAFAVLYVDLDHFKSLNDSQGHAAGDAALKGVATRLLSAMRASDPIARLGGDEFAVLCPEVSSPRDAIEVAKKIILATDSPVVVAGSVYHLSFSIGIALFPKDGANAAELLRNADEAMYAAKEAGRGTYRLAS